MQQGEIQYLAQTENDGVRTLGLLIMLSRVLLGSSIPCVAYVAFRHCKWKRALQRIYKYPCANRFLLVSLSAETVSNTVTNISWLYVLVFRSSPP